MCYIAAMERIGIRELRQHASRYITLVKAGAVVEVTERGRPVARVVPVTAEQDARASLIARGEIVPARCLRQVIDAGMLAEGDLTSVLDEMRDDQ